MAEREEILTGGNMTAVVRVGNTVRRAAGPWTPTIHAFLRHLRAAGFRCVPEPLGMDDQGREILSLLPGAAPTYPLPAFAWRDATLVAAAGTLRAFHDAGRGFVAPPGGLWRSAPEAPAEVICHNDFAPYSCVYEDGRAVGVIDFDFASPGPRLWDLAYLAYRIVPLSTDTADGFSGQEREKRLAVLLDAYGASDTMAELREVAGHRLRELGSLSDTMAEGLGKPELHEHAALYRKDAAALRRCVDTADPRLNLNVGALP